MEAQICRDTEMQSDRVRAAQREEQSRRLIEIGADDQAEAKGDSPEDQC